MIRVVVALVATMIGVGVSGVSGPAAKCIPPSKCCHVCVEGKACGNACIAKSKTCQKGRGCACDAAEVCAEDP